MENKICSFICLNKKKHFVSLSYQKNKFTKIINEWYEKEICGTNTIVIDANMFLQNLYSYCQINDAFRDENLLKNVKNIKLNNIYFAKLNINFGFIHHQILRHVEKFHMIVMEDFDKLKNRSKFKNMFKNYDKFNLHKLTFELYYWNINNMMEYMIEQPNVFIINPKLKKIVIINKWYDNKHNITIPTEFEEYYDVVIKIINKEKKLFDNDKYVAKIILSRKNK